VKRYIIVNHTTGIYAGIYYDRRWAEEALPGLRDTWPLDWEVQPVDCGFPVPGLKHLGEVRAPNILKRVVRETREEIDP